MAVDGPFLMLIDHSGAFGVLELAVLASALVLAAERAQALVFRYSLDAPAFLDQIEKLVGSRNFDRARRLCALNARSPLARVADSAVLAYEQGDAAVRRALEWSLAEQRMVVTTRVGWFRPLGVVGALLGIAGSGWAAIVASTSPTAPADSAELLRQTVISAAAPVVLGFTTAAICFALHLLIDSYARRMALYLEVGAKRLASLSSAVGEPARTVSSPTLRGA